MLFEEKIYNKLKKNTHVDRITVRKYKVCERGCFFFVKDTEKTHYVQHRLRTMQPHFLELLEIDRFENTNHTSAESFHTYGTIVNISKGRVGKDAVYIMNNIDGSNAVLVRVNLNYLAHYSVFPGQIVALKGKNVSGNELVAEEIQCMPLLDINNPDARAFARVYEKSPLVIVTACGPFSDEDNGFLVLERLLDRDPDLFILHGPFIASHTRLDDRSPFEVLRDEVLTRMEKWLRKSTTSKIILIPSLDDITSTRLLPQVPHEVDGVDERIIFLSNPCMFFVNEFLFATSSTDLLLPLISEECFLSDARNEASGAADILFRGDRVERMCYHLVFQKTFIPVFPSPYPMSLSDPTAFDTDITPDFLVFSSKVWNFQKEITPTMVINHGSQCRVENKVYSRIVIGSGSPRCTVEFHKFEDELQK